MSENYIVINGKKAELTPEQLKVLGIEVKKPSPFDRVREDEKYYAIGSTEDVLMLTECFDRADLAHYRSANYCTDKALLQQQAYRETLNRLLWRFSMENGGMCIDWNDVCQNKYYICFEHSIKKFRVYLRKSEQTVGTVYFNNLTAAERAIEEIVKPFMESHPDFKL